MNYIQLTGKIIDCGNGCESSLIIPIGDYRIMILSDDNCGAGKGNILRSEVKVYHKDSKPSDSINTIIFGNDFVIANTETLFEAFQYCQRKLKFE
jgi:hypothetical protein